MNCWELRVEEGCWPKCDHQSGGSSHDIKILCIFLGVIDCPRVHPVKLHE